MLKVCPCRLQLNPEQKWFDICITGFSASQSAVGFNQSALMRCREVAPSNVLMFKILFYFVMKRRQILAEKK
ncbi:hypothetical protein [Acaryochloris marina]|uniref:hypothetical protein n=1 Tax=Acaryochloris marina TaxID=155978 RepID=UPI0021C49BBA|nr:hypothetical protein [Acaryochloris marina]